MAVGLNYIHEHKVAHRDLSPKNIMITEEGNIKICDFGFSKKLDNSINMMKSKVGTPFYTAPEVLSQTDPEDEDEEEKKENEAVKGYGLKIDMWSLGTIIYHMLTLKKPFKSLPDIFICKYKKLDDTINPNIKSIVEKLLVIDPDQRLSAKDLLSKN